MKFLEDLSPFLEDGYCYARILSKLKVVQRHCAAHNNNVMLFDIETKTDKTEAEVKAEKKKTEILTDIVKQQERRLRQLESCLLYTSPSPRDSLRSRMPSSA